MSRENPKDTLRKMHLYLDADDMEWYKETFGQTTGLSKAVRAILRSYRNRIAAQTGQQARRVEMPQALQDEVVALALQDDRGGKAKDE